jgi:hypothetical protein
VVLGDALPPLLSTEKSACLDGRRALYPVVIDGLCDPQGDCDVYEILSSGDPQGVLFLAAGPDVEGVLLVEARLVVIRHPVHVVGSIVTPAFTEYRLVEAERQ